MAGGQPWTPEQDRAVLTLPPSAYNEWAARSGFPERGVSAILKRRTLLNQMGEASDAPRSVTGGYRTATPAPAPEAAEDVGERLPHVSVARRTVQHAPRSAQNGADLSATMPYDDIDAPPRLRKGSTDDELWDYLEQSFDRRGGEKSHEPVTRSFRSGPIGIAFLSDVHVGGGGVDLARFRADVGTISRTPNLYAVFNGDLLENTKPQLKSATALYSAQFANPKEQYGYALSRMALCRDKWLVINQGNHDQFDFRVAGIDRLEMLAHQLGVPYRTEAGATIKLTVGEQPYVIVAKHDHKGKSQLNKSNSQRRLWDEWPHEWENADVVALAHLHEPLVEHVMRKGREVVYLRSGSYKVVDAWAESGGYKPAYGVPVVIFWPGERKVLAFPGSLFAEACEYLSRLVD